MSPCTARPNEGDEHVDGDVVIIGAGGHAREALDVLEAVGERHRFLGFLSDDPTDRPEVRRRGVAVLGPPERLAELRCRFVVAVGSPLVRRRLLERATGSDDELGDLAIRLVHPTAVVSEDAELGRGVYVPAGAIVQAGATLSDHVHLNANAVVGVDAQLDDFATLSPGAVVERQAHLEEGVMLGAGAMVCQGVEVGAWSVVGAGSVVTKAVPRGVTVTGVPHRLVRGPDGRARP
ncbi:MAG: putative acetyltransferase EpsM [Acidimicrobiales bacterium]|nr:MAG: putative acetyltransferase EpsM [Acidimicrobiales bacterium]